MISSKFVSKPCRVVITTLFLFYLASTCSSLKIKAGTSNFNVLNYGAVGDGHTDASQAFLKAWEDLCQATGKGNVPTLVVPDHINSVYLLKPVAFKGPCKSNKVHIQIQGTIVAPDDMEAWDQKANWIQFSNINGLTVYGRGTIDGKGSIWWDHCKRKQDCQRPTAMSFAGCNGLWLTQLKHLNSGRNHISISGCEDVELSRLHIQAPGDSPNTDGVDIAASKNINILDSVIATGDDCVAINGRSSYINITGVQCGPGHGISVGSLGKNGAYETVEQVHVQNCSFHQSGNGLRIKTWKGWSGFVRKISYENIQIENSNNPIIITQHYFSQPLRILKKGAQISDITYRNVIGSSASKIAIEFDCFNCINIVMDHVNLTSSTASQVQASCNNAHGTESSVSPSVPCLSNTLA